ncbi:MAG: carboxypeptidase-like regulatory domain-containing protein, partial [Bacteroidales bacterium]
MRFLVSIVILVLMTGIIAINAQKPVKKFTVSGVVVDANNTPVSNVIILLNNRKLDATTDRNGFYRIKVSPSDTLLTIFMMNGGLREELINGRTTINFQLPGTLSQAALKSAAKENDDEEYN